MRSALGAAAPLPQYPVASAITQCAAAGQQPPRPSVQGLWAGAQEAVGRAERSGVVDGAAVEAQPEGRHEKPSGQQPPPREGGHW